MAATIWRGNITFGAVKIPVRFYSAVTDRTVRFHLLHAKDKVRVKQEMVNPQTGETVPREQIRRGFAAAKDTFVMLEEKELDRLEPRESRDVRIDGFLPQEEINHQWYERPYYLGADQDAPGYAALVAALSHHKLEGISRWVMRKRAYIGSLQAHHGYLVMVTLRYADEVIPAGSLPKPQGRALSGKELALAGRLIEALHGKFDMSVYHDEYRQRVLDFIEAKSKGKRPKLKLVRPPRETDEDDLAEKLAASMKSIRERVSA